MYAVVEIDDNSWRGACSFIFVFCVLDLSMHIIL